jgi:crotonobetainyl-CoA:carnitine CoA-transferase CaiB-like acyl-CoA transferase
MECTALRDDPRFNDMNIRAQNADAVDAIVDNWTRQRTTADAISAISKIGIPVGPIATIPELIAQEKKAGHTRELALENGLAVVCPIPLLDIQRGAMAPAPPSPNLRKPDASDRRPCAGVRVIEIGPYTAGPLTGRFLADLGADVIKIEPIGGEVSRKWLPSFNGISGYFANYNIGKRSVALNFSAPQDAATLWQLLKDADVVIQNLSPGALKRAGFGHEAVLAKYPNIVYCSISGYGAASGPRPALDTVIQAASGIMTQVGGNGRTGDNLPYIKVGISIADLIAAHIASLATLASLGLGSSANPGGHIDLSMLRGLAWMTQLAWPEGDSHFPQAAMIPCNDGFVVTHAAQAATNFLRILVSSTKSRKEVCEELLALGISSAPVNELYEVLTSALTTRRNLVKWITYCEQDIPILSSPHRWSAAVPHAGRCIGEVGSDAKSVISMQQQTAQKG